ncbi:hypothetical protein LIER_27606 [Lithospermum erythrorhizon]|uniref:Uncharacterized protein n=1 Tax=Lithospermum erythrorhizon TaxID=34254 RepID=A0AAV3RCY2_LITER
MFPPSAHHQNLSKQQSYKGDCGGGGEGGGYYLGGSSYFSSSSEGIFGLMRILEGGYDCSKEAVYCLGQSDLVFSPISMTEDESRTESIHEDASTSKDNILIQHQEDNKDSKNNNNNSNEDWLQLSIGGGYNSQEKQDHQHHSQHGELVELNLLPGSSSSSSQENERLLLNQRYHSLAPFGYDSSLFLQHQMGVSSSNFLLHPPQSQNNQETNLVYRPMNFSRPPPSLGIASSSSSPSLSSSFFMPPGAYFSSARMPFQLFQSGPASGIPSISLSGVHNINFRLINPPRRPHSGIWFMLQASPNQAKEPFLPQIPNSYLRIKDRRMTIRLVMKYIVNKLRLEHESQKRIAIKNTSNSPYLLFAPPS